MSTWQLFTGDAREQLKLLPTASVQCVVTSPPYWALRDYGHSGQIGLEQSADAYVAALVSVFEGVWNALADDGTAWLNLGDSYAGGGNYRGLNSENTLTAMQSHNRGAHGTSQQLGTLGRDFGTAKPKDLVGIPWRIAFALQAAGWYLRSDIIWSKPNPMPESVTDRPTKAHEYLFLLTKSPRYYYDAAAIREPYSPSTLREFEQAYEGEATKDYESAGAQNPSAIKKRITDKGRSAHMQETPWKDGNRWREADGGVAPRYCGANKRSVWTIATQPYPEAHFATFPEALVEPCILAGSKLGDLYR